LWSDAIEFNHPATPPAIANTFEAEGNYIEVPDRAGGGSSSGFGVGVAGVSGGSIRGNHIVTARNQGVHIEDEFPLWPTQVAQSASQCSIGNGRREGALYWRLDNRGA
jgi:hypothetical protein